MHYVYTYISKDKVKCKIKHVGLAKEECNPEMVIIYQIRNQPEKPISYILFFCISRASKGLISLVNSLVKRREHEKIGLRLTLSPSHPPLWRIDLPAVKKK